MRWAALWLAATVFLGFSAVPGVQRETVRRKVLLVPSAQLVPLHSTHFREQENVEEVPTSSVVVDEPFATVNKRFEGDDAQRKSYSPFNSKEEAVVTESAEAVERSPVDDASALPFGHPGHSNQPYTTETVQREEVDDENSAEGQAIHEEDQQLINQEVELDSITQSESASEETAYNAQQSEESPTAVKESANQEQAQDSEGDGSEESSEGSENGGGHHRHRFQGSVGPAKGAPRARLPSAPKNPKPAFSRSKAANSTKAKAANSTQAAANASVASQVNKQQGHAAASSIYSAPGSSARASKKRAKLAKQRQHELSLRAQHASKLKLKEIPPNMKAVPSPDMLKNNVLQLDDTEDMYSQMGLKKFTGVVVSYINANLQWADVAVRTDGDDLLKVMIKNRGLELLEHIGQRVSGWAMMIPLAGKAKLLDIHKYETS
jgi:hypothetical protein